MGFFFTDKSGMDERQLFHPQSLNVENNNENITLFQIFTLNEKKSMLDYLQSNHTDIEKLAKINKTDNIEGIDRIKHPIIFNMFNGGLLDDWNFDFDFDVENDHYHF
jgi:hypothetical protein